ncbi:MAG: hypothetical protein ABIW76_09085 [Fibrobacteria bacterium]
MPTLQKTAPTVSPTTRSASGMDACMRRIGTTMMRAAVETAGAFLMVPASQSSAWDAPRIAVPDAMHCSQMNIGENYRLLCNLNVDRNAWNKLFSAGVPDQIMLDAFCELANCISGAILADADFRDEFGYLIPCVPCNGASRPLGEARTERGCMLVGGAWVNFSFSMQESLAQGTVSADSANVSAVA